MTSVSGVISVYFYKDYFLLHLGGFLIYVGFFGGNKGVFNVSATSAYWFKKSLTIIVL